MSHRVFDFIDCVDDGADSPGRCHGVYQAAKLVLRGTGASIATIPADPRFDRPTSDCDDFWLMSAFFNFVCPCFQALFDVMIVLEVAARMLYLGEDYWEDRWNYLDLVIVALCLIATFTEHVHIFGDEGQMEIDTATGIRIVRDVVRSLRLFMFLRFLSDSIVAFQEVDPEHEELSDSGLAEDAVPESRHYGTSGNGKRGPDFDDGAGGPEGVVL